MISSGNLYLKRLLAPAVEFKSIWKLVQLELKIRYKRSAIGLAWYVLAFAMKIAVLGGVYTHVLNKEPIDYIPFLVIGVSMWTFISSSMQYGCASLISAGKYAYFDPDRIFFIIFKGVVREFLLGLILLLWSLLGIVIFVDTQFDQLFDAALGLALCFLFLYLSSSLLAFMCLAKPDISHLFSSMMNIFFIATPVLWDFKDVPQVQDLMIYNPFFYLVEVVRYPILDRELFDGFYLFFFITIPAMFVCLAFFYKKLSGNIAKYV